MKILTDKHIATFKLEKPKKKKVSKSTLKRKADKLFSKFIRSLDHCERCSKTSKQAQLQAAHIYSRRYINLRYDIDNCLALCSGCHFWAHQNPVDFYVWLNQAWPERLKKLIKKRQILKKWTIQDYENTIEEIENYTS